ncbi:hypothetical protein K491DRAFT_688690 [Lophiostoma macrostomum CBS 122681]|uniref:Uncharacterized protein n=1 Tax=Lophiostoma macrostomum CBS 122681 TaxID=1314788 RepID=A0A6A6TME8_9PLEO|nr:hypothetical protein K491DRAFT_688690 [Lophiostoma macrostomum CBS 122681]
MMSINTKKRKFAQFCSPEPEDAHFVLDPLFAGSSRYLHTDSHAHSASITDAKQRATLDEAQSSKPSYRPSSASEPETSFENSIALDEADQAVRMETENANRSSSPPSLPSYATVSPLYTANPSSWSSRPFPRPSPPESHFLNTHHLSLSEIAALAQKDRDLLAAELNVVCWNPFTVRAICTPGDAGTQLSREEREQMERELEEASRSVLPDTDEEEV